MRARVHRLFLFGAVVFVGRCQRPADLLSRVNTTTIAAKLDSDTPSDGSIQEDRSGACKHAPYELPNPRRGVPSTPCCTSDVNPPLCPRISLSSDRFVLCPWYQAAWVADGPEGRNWAFRQAQA